MQSALFIDLVTLSPDPTGASPYPARVEMGVRRGQGATFGGLASGSDLGQGNSKVYMPPAIYDAAGSPTAAIEVVPECHVVDQKGREFLLVGQALPASGRSDVDHLELSCQALTSDTFTIWRAGTTVDADGVSNATATEIASVTATWAVVRGLEEQIGGARGEFLAAVAVLRLPVDVQLNDRVVVDRSPALAGVSTWTVVRIENWRNHVRLLIRESRVLAAGAPA